MCLRTPWVHVFTAKFWFDWRVWSHSLSHITCSSPAHFESHWPCTRSLESRVGGAQGTQTHTEYTCSTCEHRPNRFHSQNTSSKTKLLRILRGWQQNSKWSVEPAWAWPRCKVGDYRSQAAGMNSATGEFDAQNPGAHAYRMYILCSHARAAVPSDIPYKIQVQR